MKKRRSQMTPAEKKADTKSRYAERRLAKLYPHLSTCMTEFGQRCDCDASKLRDLERVNMLSPTYRTIRERVLEGKTPKQIAEDIGFDDVYVNSAIHNMRVHKLLPPTERTQSRSVHARIESLSKQGLSPSEIAADIGRPRSYVSTTLFNLRLKARRAAASG